MRALPDYSDPVTQATTLISNTGEYQVSCDEYIHRGAEYYKVKLEVDLGG